MAAGSAQGPISQEGRLLRTEGGDGKVWHIAGGDRHWVVSPQEFVRRGYKWDAIQVVSPEELASWPEGAPETATSDGPPPPTLPPWPGDYEAKVRAMPLGPLPPPGVGESMETTLSRWQAVRLGDWVAERVQQAHAASVLGPLRPGTWAEAAVRGEQPLLEWLQAQRSLSFIADRAADGQRVADDAVRQRVEAGAAYKPGENSGINAAKGLANAIPVVGSIAGLLFTGFEALAAATVKAPRTGGADAHDHDDPTGEAFRLLPMDLRRALQIGAASLPPWPYEDVLVAWNAAGRLVPPLQLPVLRLVKEAKRRGFWPAQDARWPFDGATRNVASQLRAMIQVGLEAYAAGEAAGAPAGTQLPPPGTGPAPPQAATPSSAAPGAHAAPPAPGTGSGTGAGLALAGVGLAMALALGLVLTMRKRRPRRD